MMEETNQSEDFWTINFKNLFSIIWSNKLGLLLFSLIGGVIGYFYSKSLPDEFVTTGKILPELPSKGGSLGQFSSLAALAGVDINSIGGSGTDAIRADLYPDIL
ncbi:MAG: Wzz/FepE/Etk N-terminal domain-containing protein, partial [Leadbetterella sp.]